MGVCNCSMFCCTLLYVHSSIAIILMGKRELIALLNLPSWCLVMVERLFLAVPRGCLQFVIVVFPDHTHLLFLYWCIRKCRKAQQVAVLNYFLYLLYTNLHSICTERHMNTDFVLMYQEVSSNAPGRFYNLFYTICILAIDTPSTLRSL